MYHSDSGKFPKPKTWQQKVMKAAHYAACAQEHPAYRLQVMDSPVSAYSLAFLDSLGKPKLLGADISRWTGRIGQRIHFKVRDIVGVLQVRVMIREHIESNKVLESGYAYPSLLDPSIWTYVTKTELPQRQGFCVDVLASDLAGNLGVDTMEFDPV